jgi:hypothetical protein
MADEQRSVHGVRFVDSPFSDSSTGTFPEILSRRQISIGAALFAFACVLLAPGRGQLSFSHAGPPAFVPRGGPTLQTHLCLLCSD